MVTDFALQIMNHEVQVLDKEEKTGYAQIPGEINVEAVLDGKVVAEKLKRDDIEQPLQTINRFGDSDRLAARWDTVVVLVADNNRLGFTSGDLRKGGLDLGVQGVLGHDDDHRHILIDQGKRTMFEFSSKNAFGVHVGDFLDLEGTLETCGVSTRRGGSV